jgi:ABC-2 type transport system ATP-binding protein
MSNAIEVRNLGKVYRTYRKKRGLMGAVTGLFHREHDETRAVDGVSFEIAEGELVGFLGPNGAGKTTVLKMLSGLLNPSFGEALVLGYRPWKREDALKRQFSLLMGQKNALWWDLPARESLELNRAIYEIPRADFDRIVGQLTEMLDVRNQLDVMVRELSLGQRMKMELIAALLHKPKVLFLDEPTIGLDVMSQKIVREFLKSYNAESRTTIILTSHYMQDIEELCERVLLIDHGKLFFDGPLQQVIEKFASAKIIEVSFAEPVVTDFSQCGTVLESVPTRLRLEVPRGEVAEACRKILAAHDVTDLSVQEVPIEEVIRRVFGN